MLSSGTYNEYLSYLVHICKIFFFFCQEHYSECYDAMIIRGTIKYLFDQSYAIQKNEKKKKKKKIENM